MKTNYIYKDLGDDIIYVNNVGEEFLLTEAQSPIKNMTYDIIVAFKIVDDSKGFCEYADDLIWFYGASDLYCNYLKGKDSDFLDTCKTFLDKKVETPAPEDPEIFYTGGGIYCAVAKVEDGWFSGAVNEWGCVYKTREAAVECQGENSDDFIRNVEDVKEQTLIWMNIYKDVMEKGYCTAKECENIWFPNLGEDLLEAMSGDDYERFHDCVYEMTVSFKCKKN